MATNTARKLGPQKTLSLDKLVGTNIYQILAEKPTHRLPGFDYSEHKKIAEELGFVWKKLGDK